MWREILGLDKKPSTLLELLQPRRSFSDVILPPETRRQLSDALTQIRKHRLIFQHWGLGERHPTALGLAFNFAGPPGTGKTICAEAVAHSLGRKLLRVRYAELESCWAGETGKNIRSVFREARTQDAVLFFDEADSIASRRFSNVQAGYEREANQAVNILLKELEEYEGVVIFATNMAANFDPAFERRIRTHILFGLPTEDERERIWRIQFHPQKTPLGSDVDFRMLAERYEASGGDIRNAVMKAAQMAAAEEGPDETKRILQPHLERAIEEVLVARQVMQQNAVGGDMDSGYLQVALEAQRRRLDTIAADTDSCRTEIELLVTEHRALCGRAESLETGLAAVPDTVAGKISEALAPLESDLQAQRTAWNEWECRTVSRLEALQAALSAIETRLADRTILPWPRRVTAAAASLLALSLVAAGAAVRHFLVGG